MGKTDKTNKQTGFLGNLDLNVLSIDKSSYNTLHVPNIRVIGPCS